MEVAPLDDIHTATCEALGVPHTTRLQIFFGGEDVLDGCTVKECDLQTGAHLDVVLQLVFELSGESRELRGHTDGVLCVVQLADGRVVSGSFDKSLRVWD